MAHQLETVGKLKIKLSAEGYSGGCNVEFLPGFTDGAGFRRFPRVDASARTVDFTRSQAPFLADQKNFVAGDDENQGCHLVRYPFIPVDLVKGSDGWRSGLHQATLPKPPGQSRSRVGRVAGLDVLRASPYVSGMKFFLLVLGIFAVCMVAMAVGIIIRNKGFTTCGRAAAAAMEGGEGTCSVCGAGSGSCRKKEEKG